MTDQEQPFPIEEDPPKSDMPTEGELSAALADLGERDEEGDDLLPTTPPNEEQLRAMYGDQEPENLPGPPRIKK